MSPIKERDIEQIVGQNLIFDSKDFSEKDCFFTEFNNEYLFCCGIIEHIKCFRLYHNLTIIKEFNFFNIDSPKKNSYLTIKINNLYILFLII